MGDLFFSFSNFFYKEYTLFVYIEKEISQNENSTYRKLNANKVVSEEIIAFADFLIKHELMNIGEQDIQLQIPKEWNKNLAKQKKNNYNEFKGKIW